MPEKIKGQFFSLFLCLPGLPIYETLPAYLLRSWAVDSKQSRSKVRNICPSKKVQDTLPGYIFQKQLVRPQTFDVGRVDRVKKTTAFDFATRRTWPGRECVQKGNGKKRVKQEEKRSTLFRRYFCGVAGYIQRQTNNAGDIGWERKREKKSLEEDNTFASFLPKSQEADNKQERKHRAAVKNEWEKR